MNPIELNKFSIAENYNGFLELEKQGHCFIEKLRSLENQLQDARIKVQALTFSKMELEKMLEKERKELENTKSQLKVFQDAMQYWEKEHLNEKNSLMVQSLQIDILQKEKISLNEELQNLEVKQKKKNIELTLQAEEIKKQSQNQSHLANLLNFKKKTFENIVEKIYGESQKLEKEFNFLKKQVALSKHTGEQMIVLLKHHHEALNKVFEENESLKRSLFAHAGELRLEKNTPKISHDINLDRIEIQTLQKKLKENENSIIDLNRELDSEKEGKRKLNETLDIVLSDQIKFNDMEQYFRTCISNLESQLEKKFQSNVD